eukprot:TRINITY_DN3842_c0_g1_i2.p1 TRINITY_DN3842_c0_g1~~TRINITY_DN3842_c0_g1_i2.p1  ORF type:complete len:302 (-),score=39.28 TRINITY_DN3842_c0_g1_i2:729-1634(-)
MRLLLLCLLLLISAVSISGFQSDELSVEEDEWAQAEVTAPVTEKPILRQSVGSSGDELRSTGEVSRATGSASADRPAADQKIEFLVEHSFGDSRFSPAGVISARLRLTSQGRQSLSKFRIVRNAFSGKEQEDFKKLVKTDGFYSVRLPANLAAQGNNYVQTAVKARCLSARDFEEHFELHLEQAQVLGLSLRPLVDCPFPRPEVYPKRWEPKPRLVVKHSEPGPRLVSLLQDLGPPGEIGPDGEGQKPAEKTFWQKYWMYIIPVAMITLNAIQTVANMPDDSAGQGAAQAGQQRGQLARRR